MNWLELFRRALLVAIVALCLIGLVHWVHGEETASTQSFLANTLWTATVDDASVDLKFDHLMAREGIASIRFNKVVGWAQYRLNGTKLELSGFSDPAEMLTFTVTNSQLYSKLITFTLVTNTTREWWK